MRFRRVGRWPRGCSTGRMTRSFHPPTRRVRRTTQPMIVVRLRDPSIRSLGFSTFRAVATDGEMIVFPYADPRNQMTVFAR